MKNLLLYLLIATTFTTLTGCGMYARKYPLDKYTPSKPNFKKDSVATAFLKATGADGEFKDVKVDPALAAKTTKTLPQMDTDDYVFSAAVNNIDLLGKGTPIPGMSMGQTTSFLVIGALLADSDSADKRKQTMDLISRSNALLRFGIWLPSTDFQTPEQARNWIADELLAFIHKTTLNNYQLGVFHLNKYPQCPPSTCKPDLDVYQIFSLQQGYELRPGESAPYYDDRPGESKWLRGGLTVGIAETTQITPFENPEKKQYQYVSGKLTLNYRVVPRGALAAEDPAIIGQWMIALSKHLEGKNFYIGQYLHPPRGMNGTSIPAVLHDGKYNFFLKLAEGNKRE